MVSLREQDEESFVLAEKALKEAAVNLITFLKKVNSVKKFCPEELNIVTLRQKIKINEAALEKAWRIKLYLLEEEYQYFYYLIYQKSFLEVFSPLDQDIAVIDDKMNNLDFAIGLHSTLDTLQDVVIQNEVTPFLSSAKFLSGLGIFAQCLPPIWTALNGVLGFWDIYLKLNTQQTRLANGVRLTTTAFGIGLGVAALAFPPVAIILGAAAMGMGLFRDGFSYFDVRDDYDKECVQLAEYQCRLEKLKGEESQEITSRKIFLEHAIKKQEERVEELRIVCNDRRFNLFLSGTSILGMLMLVPPLTAVGVSIILTLTAVGVERRWGILSSISKAVSHQLKNIFCSKSKGKIKKEYELKAVFDKDAKSILAHFNRSVEPSRVTHSETALKEAKIPQCSSKETLCLGNDLSEPRALASMSLALSSPDPDKSAKFICR